MGMSIIHGWKASPGARAQLAHKASNSHVGLPYTERERDASEVGRNEK